MIESLMPRPFSILAQTMMMLPDPPLTPSSCLSAQLLRR